MTPVFDTPIHSNDQSIDRVLAAGLPVALVFLDEAPSTALNQTMERLAREQAGEMLLVKINARENPSTRSSYNINSLPAVVTVRQGQTLSQADAISAASLEKHVAYLLGKGPKPQAETDAARPQTASRPSTAGQASSAGRPSTAGRPSSAAPAGGNGGPAGAPTAPVNATDATFESEVMRASLPVVVDFWAPWCGPCRMTDPILIKLARELAGRVKIVKVNVDENPRVAGQYGVQSIPTMLVVKNGKVSARWVGALPEPALRSKLAQYI